MFGHAKRMRNEEKVLDDLERHGESHAFAISRRIDMSDAATYVALSWLERRGDVESRWQDMERPRRRLYRLGRGGRRRRLATPAESRSVLERLFGPIPATA